MKYGNLIWIAKPLTSGQVLLGSSYYLKDRISGTVADILHCNTWHALLFPV